MKIVVCGDYIEDFYEFGTATRLCPEAPVPVVIPESTRTSAGGAGLVAGQLRELGADVWTAYGSKSTKRRIFAGNSLVCRIDIDTQKLFNLHFDDVAQADAYVISDYGKGGMNEILANRIVLTGKPCFVDAKPHWPWYAGKNVTIFPNHQEASPVSELPAGTFKSYEFGRVVNKLGKDGCRLNDAENRDYSIPAMVTEVVDTCGAGDVFMASFVYAMVCEKLTAKDSLIFANSIAGESCRHRGTFVVGKEFAAKVLDSLRVWSRSAQLAPYQVNYSSAKEHLPANQISQREHARSGILREDFFEDREDREAAAHIRERVQTLQKSPSIPKPLNDVQTQEENGWEQRNRSLSEE